LAHSVDPALGKDSSGSGGNGIADYPAQGRGIAPLPNEGEPLVMTLASPEMGMNATLAMNPHPA
jgi:hypothetical protein